MKIACMSDIHGYWDRIDYPKADVLVLAGDILSNYHRNPEIDAVRQLEEIEALDRFFGELKSKGTYQDIVFVAGNHDWAFQLKARDAVSLLTNCTYLQDKSAKVQGVTFYGSPWQPFFHSWAFNFPDPKVDPERTLSVTRACWDAIAVETQVLVTHGPPRNILDLTMRGDNVGCPELTDRLPALVNLRAHVFGHIHHSRGTEVQGKTTFVNAAICDERYDPNQPIQVIEI